MEYGAKECYYQNRSLTKSNDKPADGKEETLFVVERFGLGTRGGDGDIDQFGGGGGVVFVLQCKFDFRVVGKWVDAVHGTVPGHFLFHQG